MSVALNSLNNHAYIVWSIDNLIAGSDIDIDICYCDTERHTRAESQPLAEWTSSSRLLSFPMA